MHAVVYLSAWSETGKLMNMAEKKNFAGAIAGMAMLIIGLSTITFLMRNTYESERPFHNLFQLITYEIQYSILCTWSCLS